MYISSRYTWVLPASAFYLREIYNCKDMYSSPVMLEKKSIQDIIKWLSWE